MFQSAGPVILPAMLARLATTATWIQVTAREGTTPGLARALRAAVAIDPRAKDEVPSTKGSLGGGSL